MWTWLKRLLLPYEFEDHPLHAPKPYDAGEDPEWDELGAIGTGSPEAFRRSHDERAKFK